MSDFAAFFPTKDCDQVPASFQRLDKTLRGPLKAQNVQSSLVHGAPVLLSQSFARGPRFFAKEDGSGWIVVKGIIFDVVSESPIVNLERLLDQILAEAPGDLNRYEGTFALAAWDAREAQGWAVNDQTSLLNLYYGEQDGGLYVATNALALARAIGLGLDPWSVLQFLMTSVTDAPDATFAGLRRVNVGEHIHYRSGRLSQSKHWSAYASRARYFSGSAAAEAIAPIIVDRASRYAAVANPVLSDLTGGLDTRLLTCAAGRAGVELTVTVNGSPEWADVKLAHEVAETMHWKVRHYNTASLWTSEFTPEMRRDLTYRTSGELPFAAIYHHLSTGPALGENFNLHMIGTGGDLYRTFPWEETWKLRRGAFATVRMPPRDLFSHDFASRFYSKLRSRIRTISEEGPGASLSQQLDATFVWKMTSHSSLYLSALHNWLPSAAPLMSAGIVKMAVAMPPRMRMGGQLQRHIISWLAPQAAKVDSFHSASLTRRGTAEPTLRSLGQELQRNLGRFARSADRRLLGRRFTKLPPPDPTSFNEVPFLTQEFRRFLDPGSMYSRSLYAGDGLRLAVGGDDAAWQEKVRLMLRLGTVEQLCRELDFKPAPTFWAPVMAGEG